MKKRKIDSDRNFGINNIELAGIDGDPLDEVKGTREVSLSEKVLSKGNVVICMGRDRESGVDTGYSATGDTRCDSLDIYIINGSDKDRDPDFSNDPVRFYMAEKTDIDKYFRLNGEQSEGCSAMGLKGDAVRIMSREGGIKLITLPEGNSRGGDSYVIPKIILNVGNSEKTVPVVNGDNLKECLESMMKEIEDLNSIVGVIVDNLMKLDSKIAKHFHFSPFFGKPTTFSNEAFQGATEAITELVTKIKTSLVKQQMNLSKLKVNFLTFAGKGNIRSRNIEVSK